MSPIRPSNGSQPPAKVDPTARERAKARLAQAMTDTKNKVRGVVHSSRQFATTTTVRAKAAAMAALQYLPVTPDPNALTEQLTAAMAGPCNRLTAALKARQAQKIEQERSIKVSPEHYQRAKLIYQYLEATNQLPSLAKILAHQPKMIDALLEASEGLCSFDFFLTERSIQDAEKNLNTPIPLISKIAPPLTEQEQALKELILDEDSPELKIKFDQVKPLLLLVNSYIRGKEDLQKLCLQSKQFNQKTYDQIAKSRALLTQRGITIPGLDECMAMLTEIIAIKSQQTTRPNP